MEKENSVPSLLIQKFLEPDEQILWWEHPDKKNIKTELIQKEAVSMMLWMSVIPLTNMINKIISVYDPTTDNHIIFLYKLLLALLGYTIFALLAAMSLSLLYQTLNRPMYYKHTIYTITNKRILIGLSRPHQRPLILVYQPEEILDLASSVRHNGSGSVTFSEPRKLKPSRYEPEQTFPGSFIGVRNVEQVIEILNTLKNN